MSYRATDNIFTVPLGHIVDHLLKPHPKEHAYSHTLLRNRSSVRLCGPGAELEL